MSGVRVGEGAPPPVITVVQRGQITEAAHRGDVAVVAAGGVSPRAWASQIA
jgi:L-asparaginase II